jgi:esterase/lipase
MNTKNLKPNSGSFFKPGGRIGCLLLHSSTGSPSSMKPLVKHLST